MSNLTVRILSALLMMAAGVGGLIADPRSRFLVIALVLTLGAWEFSRMLGAKLGGPRGAPLSAAALVLALLLPHYPGLSLEAGQWAWGFSCLAVLLFTALGFFFLDISNMAPWIYLNLFGIAYLGLYGAGLYNLLGAEAGWHGILRLFMVQILISGADTGAYFTGRAIGKRKLAPRISSGKTVEGAIGGAVLTLILALAMGPYFLGLSWPVYAGLGLLMGVTAILGDLFISVLKRYSGFKDSSHIIPGHGGILDRFDSLVFSGPVAAFYLSLFL